MLPALSHISTLYSHHHDPSRAGDTSRNSHDGMHFSRTPRFPFIVPSFLSNPSHSCNLEKARNARTGIRQDERNQSCHIDGPWCRMHWSRVIDADVHAHTRAASRSTAQPADTWVAAFFLPSRDATTTAQSRVVVAAPIGKQQGPEEGGRTEKRATRRLKLGHLFPPDAASIERVSCTEPRMTSIAVLAMLCMRK